MLEQLARMEQRYQELERELSTPEVGADSTRYVRLAKEHGALREPVMKYRRLKQAQDRLRQAQELLQAEDPDMRELARQEVEETEQRIELLEREILEELITEDETSQRNVIVEIRAGTGGEEASLFAGDLLRMYGRYAEERGWKVELMDSSPTDLGGFREVIFSVSGRKVYRDLRYESGVHRVQRVPETESQGRIHTSACSVAILPEAEEVEVDIDEEKDLRIDIFHSSGPGGQSVNKVASAVRITHLPTGLAVAAQDERSQRQNRQKAMRILRSRLLDTLRRQQQEERAGMRRLQIGSGDRSERIRTYNFPQNRVTDHRINLTLYQLDRILQGELDLLIEPLRAHDRELQLQGLSTSGAPAPDESSS